MAMGIVTGKNARSEGGGGGGDATRGRGSGGKPVV